MSNEQILAVDDEEDILELIRYNLSREGFKVHCCASAEEAGKALAAAAPAAILLDLMLPGMNGLDFCRKLRANAATQGIPIIMISAKGEEADIVAGLELGADDYITKPFSPRVLVARVRAVLRRPSDKATPAAEILEIHELKIDSARHEAHLAGELLPLSATEFRLLQFLAAYPGRVFTRSQIVSGVHGDDYPVTDRSVDVQILGVRRKLGRFESYIETIRGVGYRFKE